MNKELKTTKKLEKMKNFEIKLTGILTLVFTLFLLVPSLVKAQDEEVSVEKKIDKPVRNPWGSSHLIETQNTVVWAPKTLEFVIQHRFGELNSGSFDLIGLYAPSNVRMGLNYTVVNRFQLGLGTTKDKKLQDFNYKVAILVQNRSGKMPVSLTYYGNTQLDARDQEIYGAEYTWSNRISYFNQLILGRKFSKAFSLQISGSYAHYNFLDSTATPDLKHDNFGVGIAGRVKVGGKISILFEWDMPLTTPDYIKPNYSLGVEIATSSHCFQIFFTTYDGINYQDNLTFNTNDAWDGDVLIGFNIIPKWNF
ncbi:MAG: hypothetical protein DRI54_04485 [Bacteroidetes bacterium]|nr:MAG: hypothetical protein DRI54_04485 [Bacteroidota bacterium]